MRLKDNESVLDLAWKFGIIVMAIYETIEYFKIETLMP